MVCSLSPTTPVIADADTGYVTRFFFFFVFRVLTCIAMIVSVGLLWSLAPSTNTLVLA